MRLDRGRFQAKVFGGLAPHVVHIVKPPSKVVSLRDGAVVLFAYANYANYLPVANAYLSGNGPAVQ